MLQEPSDELLCIQGEYPFGPIVFIILVKKTDFTVLVSNNTVVADSYPMRVVSQIPDQVVCAGKRFFTIHDPGRFITQAFYRLKILPISRQGQTAVRKGTFQQGTQHPAEHSA